LVWKLRGNQKAEIEISDKQMSNPTTLLQKLWNYCNILRDDGPSFHLRQAYGGQDGDYAEQLTFLLFLKMTDEQSWPPFNPPPHQGFGGTGKPRTIPEGYDWPSLLARHGDQSETH
jgi:type I restriction enzyme M protein